MCLINYLKVKKKKEKKFLLKKKKLKKEVNLFYFL